MFTLLSIPISLRKKLFGVCALSVIGFLIAANSAHAASIPEFVSKNGRHALMVDGEPFLMLGMQANNSSNYPDT
ncbi:MAG: hypothetical protein EOO68_09960, partial [Moraxellaceae bacterium]